MSEHEQPTAEEAQQADWSRLADEALGVDQKAGVINEETAEQLAVDSAPEPEIESAALLTQVIEVTASVLAPNWQLQHEECEQLGGVYGKLLDKYMPNSGLEKYSAELSALMVTAMVFGSRAGVPRHKPEEKEVSQDDDAEVQSDET